METNTSRTACRYSASPGCLRSRSCMIFSTFIVSGFYVLMTILVYNVSLRHCKYRHLPRNNKGKIQNILPQRLHFVNFTHVQRVCTFPTTRSQNSRAIRGMVKMEATVVTNVISVISEGLRPYFMQNIVPNEATGMAMTTVLMLLTTSLTPQSLKRK